MVGGKAGAKASSGTDHDKLEVSCFYDSASNLPSGVAPGGWTGGPYTTGRAIAVFDRASASFTQFDGRAHDQNPNQGGETERS